MEIYIIEDYKEKYQGIYGRELTDMLIKDCLEEHGVENPIIVRTTNGKPYIDGDIHFSVSHSGNYFVCVIAEKNVGIDIQIQRKADTNKIAERYFTSEEIQFIEEGKEAAFFYIWARKEAYSKYTGKGLEELMKGTPVLNRQDVEFIDFQLEEGMWCSCCIERK